jgi:hypothetical protein
VEESNLCAEAPPVSHVWALSAGTVAFSGADAESISGWRFSETSSSNDWPHVTR